MTGNEHAHHAIVDSVRRMAPTDARAFLSALDASYCHWHARAKQIDGLSASSEDDRATIGAARNEAFQHANAIAAVLNRVDGEMEGHRG